MNIKLMWFAVSLSFVTSAFSLYGVFMTNNRLNKQQGAESAGLDAQVQEMRGQINRLAVLVNEIDDQHAVSNSSDQETTGLKSVMEELAQISDRLETLEQFSYNNIQPEAAEIEGLGLSSYSQQTLSEDEYIAYIDAHHYAQAGGDNAWAESVLEYINYNIENGTIAGVHVNEIDCRSETCKIDIAVNDAAQGEALSGQILEKVTWNSQHLLSIQDDRFLIYLSASDRPLVASSPK
jgi:hypothetical protein